MNVKDFDQLLRQLLTMAQVGLNFVSWNPVTVKIKLGKYISRCLYMKRFHNRYLQHSHLEFRIC